MALPKRAPRGTPETRSDTGATTVLGNFLRTPWGDRYDRYGRYDRYWFRGGVQVVERPPTQGGVNRA